MNTPPDDDEQLTSLLRAQMPPLPDHGFSAQVMARLPAPRRSPHGLLLVIGGAVAGIGFACVKISTSSDAAPTPILDQLHALLANLCDPSFLIAAFLTAVSLTIAYLVQRAHAAAWK